MCKMSGCLTNTIKENTKAVKAYNYRLLSMIGEQNENSRAPYTWGI